MTDLPPSALSPLDLDAQVPCWACGGTLRWMDFAAHGPTTPAYATGWCSCGVEWAPVPAPVTWRLLATTSPEIPAVYVGKLVAEVDRLSAQRDQLTTEVNRLSDAYKQASSLLIELRRASAAVQAEWAMCEGIEACPYCQGEGGHLDDPNGPCPVGVLSALLTRLDNQDLSGTS